MSTNPNLDQVAMALNPVTEENVVNLRMKLLCGIPYRVRKLILSEFTKRFNEKNTAIQYRRGINDVLVLYSARNKLDYKRYTYIMGPISIYAPEVLE